MTKWQESCITALASSPMAWEAFKMKQRNKKLLWQYVNRIWPYKLITGTKVNKNKKDLLAIAKILKNLSSKIQYYVPSIERACCIEDVDIRFDKVDWFCIKDIISKEDSEYRRKYNSLNVGIEIEHDAEYPTPDKIQRAILLNNCVSYDSGYDGNSSNRLRENRIQLNGIKGLKGLYILLTNMKENCAIAKNSSVHMHIDCKYDNFFMDRSKFYKGSEKDCIYGMVDVLAIRMSKYQSNTDSALQIISDIVEYEVTRYHFNTIDYTRYNDEFNTIEYRFAKINFNYSDYVIQILTFIHITECIKHDAPFNIQYLELLYKVMKNLNNNQVSDLTLKLLALRCYTGISVD